MFKLQFSTANAVFDGMERNSEIARILRNLAISVENLPDSDGVEWLVYDINGNRIGRLELSEQEESE